MISLGYRIPIETGKIIRSGHGMAIELGLNPGMFIQKDLVLGMFGGWAWRDVMWSSFFHEDFKRDYNTQVNDQIDNLSHSPDSSIIKTSNYLFSNQRGKAPLAPNCETKSFHDYSLYYGLMVALPFKNSPLLKVYAGYTRAHFQGDGKFEGKQYDYTIFQLRRPMQGLELMLFRGFSFKRTDIYKHGDLRLAALSLYYEQSNFTKSGLYFDNGEYTRNIALEKFCSAEFLKNYKRKSATV
ncbi:MAG: hypothetical protein JNL60_18145 [Bacteroidia bacterium]|nr:hypothetical protein [Bacteroidia bacterium]